MYIRYFNAFPVISSWTKILTEFSQIKFSELTKSGNYSKHLKFTAKTNYLSEKISYTLKFISKNRHREHQKNPTQY